MAILPTIFKALIPYGTLNDGEIVKGGKILIKNEKA
jgi:hypothetical protein